MLKIFDILDLCNLSRLIIIKEQSNDTNFILQENYTKPIKLIIILFLIFKILNQNIKK
jgi:hypothetical protein